MLPKNWGLKYKVRFSEKGLQRWRKLDKQIEKRLIEKVRLLADFKSLNMVKKMSGKAYRDIYRLRVGDLRVIFRVVEEERVVWIIDVGFRGSVYQ